jgi:ABC-type Mn2+/Zn2+ transport system permease subunit
MRAAGRVMPAPFDTPYMQRALAEALMLAVLGGVLGSWIVLRRLAFFTHGVGTATFPGLVAAGPLGIAPQLAAFGAALVYAGALGRLSRSRRVTADAATGLLVVAALALGAVLASDVFRSGAGVDRLLVGSLIALRPHDLWLTAAALVAALAVEALGRRAWLATGMDPDGATALGLRVRAADLALLVAVAGAAVVALDAVGALLVSVVLVVPAATVRLVAPSIAALRVGAIVLGAVEAVTGLVVAWALDVGPGPALAVLAGAVFAAVALLGPRVGEARA